MLIFPWGKVFFYPVCLTSVKWCNHSFFLTQAEHHDSQTVAPSSSSLATTKKHSFFSMFKNLNDLLAFEQTWRTLESCIVLACRYKLKFSSASNSWENIVAKRLFHFIMLHGTKGWGWRRHRRGVVPYKYWMLCFFHHIIKRVSTKMHWIFFSFDGCYDIWQYEAAVEYRKTERGMMWH